MSAKPGQIAALKALLAKAEVRRATKAAVDEAAVRRVVAAAISERCGLPPEHLREAHTLCGRLGLNKLDRLWLAVTLEEQLLLTATIQSWPEWQSVADVVAAALAAARAATGAAAR